MLDPDAVDLDGLAQALQDQGYDSRWLIDPRIGEIVAANRMRRHRDVLPDALTP